MSSNSALEPSAPITTGLIRIAPAWFGKTSAVRSLLLWAAGILALVAVIFCALRYGSLDQVVRLVRSAHPLWLVLALAAQVPTYLCAALVWRQALAHCGRPLPMRTLIPLGIAKVFTDQVLPSGGISGTMLVVRGLIRRQVDARIAMAAMLAGMVSFDVAYLIVVLASTAILELHHHAALPILIGVTIFVVMTIAIPAAVLGLKRWGNRKPIAWLSKLLGMTGMLRALTDAPTDLLRDPALLLQTIALQLCIFLLDALTLWLVFNALGVVPDIWAVLVSFAIASMVATIGPIPVGLGTFEAASVATLSLVGVSVNVALAATLLLRALTFWLPMIPGIWLARREIVRR